MLSFPTAFVSLARSVVLRCQANALWLFPPWVQCVAEGMLCSPRSFLYVRADRDGLCIRTGAPLKQLAQQPLGGLQSPGDLPRGLQVLLSYIAATVGASCPVHVPLPQPLPFALTCTLPATGH